MKIPEKPAFSKAQMDKKKLKAQIDKKNKKRIRPLSAANKLLKEKRIRDQWELMPKKNKYKVGK